MPRTAESGLIGLKRPKRHLSSGPGSRGWDLNNNRLISLAFYPTSSPHLLLSLLPTILSPFHHENHPENTAR